MVQYRRNRVAGGSYFLTVTLQDRQQRYLVEHVARLREAFRVTMRRRPFVIDAIVVLPDHLHCIWTLPPGDDDYPARCALCQTAAPAGHTRQGRARRGGGHLAAPLAGKAAL